VNGTFPITVRVSDSATNGQQQTATYTCNIIVTASLAITAPCPATTAVQGAPYSFTVTAAGGQTPLTWQLFESSLPAGLTLNPQTGVISGTPTVNGTFPITVRVSDAGTQQQTATYTCNIIVTASLAITAPCPATTAVQGAPYSFTVTAAGGQTPLTWQLFESSLPAGLTLNPQTGVISGTPTVNGTFPITVRVSDAGTQQQTATYTCNIIVTASLAITAPCPATTAVQGAPYSFTVTAAGGQTPLTWQLFESSLPAGLTLNPQTGVISGTPTVNGTFPITVRVSDAGTQQQTATYTCNIIVTASLAITAPCPATTAVQGAPYSFTVTAAGGQTPLTWQLIDSSLPAGLTLNPQTGVISGTPTVNGTFPITVRVSDSATNGQQQTATYTCNIIVTAALSITAPCPATTAVQGAPYSFTVTGRRWTPCPANPAHLATLFESSLPAGLTLNPQTGVISGTPTVNGTFPITVRVSDARRTANNKPPPTPATSSSPRPYPSPHPAPPPPRSKAHPTPSPSPPPVDKPRSPGNCLKAPYRPA
jgi:P2-related tail formation protein